MDKALRVELTKREKSLYVGSSDERSRGDQADGGKGEGNGAEPASEG